MDISLDLFDDGVMLRAAAAAEELTSGNAGAVSDTTRALLPFEQFRYELVDTACSRWKRDYADWGEQDAGAAYRESKEWQRRRKECKVTTASAQGYCLPQPLLSEASVDPDTGHKPWVQLELTHLSLWRQWLKGGFLEELMHLHVHPGGVVMCQGSRMMHVTTQWLSCLTMAVEMHGLAAHQLDVDLKNGRLSVDDVTTALHTHKQRPHHHFLVQQKALVQALGPVGKVAAAQSAQKSLRMQFFTDTIDCVSMKGTRMSERHTVPLMEEVECGCEVLQTRSQLVTLRVDAHRLSEIHDQMKGWKQWVMEVDTEHIMHVDPAERRVSLTFSNDERISTCSTYTLELDGLCRERLLAFMKAYREMHQWWWYQYHRESDEQRHPLARQVDWETKLAELKLDEEQAQELGLSEDTDSMLYRQTFRLQVQSLNDTFFALLKKCNADTQVYLSLVQTRGVMWEAGMVLAFGEAQIPSHPLQRELQARPVTAEEEKVWEEFAFDETAVRAGQSKMKPWRMCLPEFRAECDTGGAHAFVPTAWFSQYIELAVE